jgi:hypothetical protein
VWIKTRNRLFKGASFDSRYEIVNRIFLTISIASTLLAVSAFGQYDRPYGDRDYARQDRGLFDKARMDLDRAGAYQYASRADRKRSISRAASIGAATKSTFSTGPSTTSSA